MTRLKKTKLGRPKLDKPKRKYTRRKPLRGAEALQPSGPQVHDYRGMVKADVSSELWREYEHFDKETGALIKTHVPEPKTLFIKEKAGRTGSHRVLTTSGEVYYIPEDWKKLKWMPRDKRKAVEF